MSTYLYLECLDHDPYIKSNGEVGQHTYDLPDIRKMIAKRDEIVAIADMDNIEFSNHWAHTMAYFFRQHPKCNIGIRDEYDRTYDLTGDLQEGIK